MALLAVPSAHASALYGALDILSTAGMSVAGGDAATGEAAIEPVIVGADTSPVIGWNGVVIHPHRAIDDCTAPDAVFVPSLGEPDGSMPPFDPRVLDWVREQYRRGAIIAAACAGVAVPAAAGLLNGRKATSHWAYVGQFRRAFPDVELEAERALVLCGDESRLVTAGGGSLWTDLVLYLIARLVGQEAAVQSSKLYLVDRSRDSQLPYACMQERLQHADSLVRKAQACITDHLVEPDVLVRAREATALTRRTFERRFRSATGVSPVRYLQQLRVERAKEILERSDTPVEDVADRVGYSDPASFRRLFSRLVGVTPAEYRRRFGSKW